MNTFGCEWTTCHVAIVIWRARVFRHRVAGSDDAAGGAARRGTRETPGLEIPGT